MKLNYKRTILVGFAFFLISAFLQAYDATIPVILTNKFGMSQTWSGVIMALDNILALFMLPLFGALSDKHRGKHGKRTPFILFGTILAALALFGLSFVDSMQLGNIQAVSQLDDPAALVTVYDAKADAQLKTPDGDEFVLQDLYTREEYAQIKVKVLDPEKTEALFVEAGITADASQIKQFPQLKEALIDGNLAMVGPAEDISQLNEFLKKAGYESTAATITNPEYTDYVAPARQDYVADITAANPGSLVFFIALLLVVLLSMATFRSPAVALMPDVTVKPLRSKANAVINLMGTAGGILVLVLGMVFKTSSVENAMMSYISYYAVIAGVMLIALFIFRMTVREKKWSEEMQQKSIQLGIEEEVREDAPVKRGLSKSEKTSLLLILASIALWYFGYNAVTSKYSVYATNILDKNYNTTMLLAQAAAVVAYLPAGMVASKIGRKKTILAGVVMLATAFGVAAFMRADDPDLLMNAMFILAGVAWATINVNSFPMVVEMCSGSDIGKYTGYYYTASMAAQIATPMLSGLLMDTFAETILFPYAAVFVALAFVTMFFVKHGDAKVTAKKGLEALDIED